MSISQFPIPAATGTDLIGFQTNDVLPLSTSILTQGLYQAVDIVGELQVSSSDFSVSVGENSNYFVVPGNADSIRFATTPYTELWPNDSSSTWTLNDFETNFGSSRPYIGLTDGKGRVFFGGNNGFSVISEDNGATYSFYDAGSSIDSGFYANNKFYISQSSTLYTSTDGRTWTSKGSMGVNGESLVYSEYYNRILAFNRNGGSAYSDDDGDSWTYVTVNPGGYYPRYNNNVIAIEKDDNTILLAGSFNSKVLRSLDGGITWTIAASQATQESGADIRAISYNPSLDVVFVGDYAGFVGVSSNDTYTSYSFLSSDFGADLTHSEYGGGVTFMFNQSGEIFLTTQASADLNNWLKIPNKNDTSAPYTTNTDESIESAVYVDGYMIAGGRYGKIIKSPLYGSKTAIVTRLSDFGFKF